MENYFSIKKYFSNSFLSKINAEINGNPMPFADASFYSFGREFEDCLLYSNNTQNDMVRAMVMVTIKNDTYKKIISNNRLKIQHEWYGNFMGLPFKAKADMLIKDLLVIDIKTTSCSSLADFMDTIKEYDYDRQMYVYMEVFKCKNSCIIGISKSKNPKVFVVPIAKKSYLWESGKEKTESIVAIIKSLNLCK